MEFRIGDKALGLNLGWEGTGNSENPLKRCDVVGTITSIKEVNKNHNNVHKYEFSWEKGKLYTNNKPFHSNSSIGILKRI
jgi:hypothetical protein